MIEHAETKRQELLDIIKSSIDQFDKRYKAGPSLYFYNRVFQKRKEAKNISAFLASDYNIELMYAALLSWDMDSRAAKMKNYEPFKKSIVESIGLMRDIEKTGAAIADVDIDALTGSLKELYNTVHLMRTRRRLISNAKLFHFLFPDLLMPIDRRYGLTYLYGSTDEPVEKSVKKYVDIIQFSHSLAQDMVKQGVETDETGWNKTIPKIIDNAFILRKMLKDDEEKKGKDRKPK